MVDSLRGSLPRVENACVVQCKRSVLDSLDASEPASTSYKNTFVSGWYLVESEKQKEGNQKNSPREVRTPGLKITAKVLTVSRSAN